jgi:hypothetical protein
MLANKLFSKIQALHYLRLSLLLKLRSASPPLSGCGMLLQTASLLRCGLHLLPLHSLTTSAGYVPSHPRSWALILPRPTFIASRKWSPSLCRMSNPHPLRPQLHKPRAEASTPLVRRVLKALLHPLRLPRHRPARQHQNI